MYVCAARAVGWRVLLLGAGAYSALYVYERLSWTTRAKERALKRQYVAFASEKLRYIVHVTAEACAGQARQELISAHRRLRREAERSERVMHEQERDAQHEIELLEQLSGEAKYHRYASIGDCFSMAHCLHLFDFFICF